MQALYRKYRPETFNEVIGQDHITKTLISRVKTGRIGHAYLFTGSRGTGKTTCAKIFSRAVNCLTPNEGSPCGKCDVCIALKNQGNIDIIEMDAASNNGVNEIRNIVENVMYTPIHGKYKVYIIDEVHMLSSSAFNALLKTIEEPPSHVIFILATTEVHKLPATILSRCMRFDFRLVPLDLLIEIVGRIYKEEGIKFDKDAVAAIAQAGEGSVRDALSVADRCIDYNGKVTAASVFEILGKSGMGEIKALFEAITLNHAGDALRVINGLAVSGKSMAVTAKDIVKYSRDLLVFKTSDGSFIIDTEENKSAMRAAAENYSIEQLCSIIQMFSDTEQELRYSLNPRLVLESTAIRACKLYSTDISALEERISRLEKNGVVQAQPIMPMQNNSTNNNTAKPMDAVGIWGRITTYFRTNNRINLHYLAGKQNDLEIKGGKLYVYADNEDFLQLSEPEFLEEIRRALIFDGTAIEVVIEKKKSDSVDMDSEIERIKKLVGNTKVDIK